MKIQLHAAVGRLLPLVAVTIALGGGAPRRTHPLDQCVRRNARPRRRGGCGAVAIVGSTGVTLTDIAFAPNGDLYGLTFTDLYRVNPLTAAVTLVGPHGIPSGNALVFGGGGVLYAAGDLSTNLYSINPSTGASTVLGDIGAASAGDLAFVNGDLYMSSNTNNLIRIQLAPTVTGTNVGNLGIEFVYGLATPDNGTLYAVSIQQIYSVNVATAATTLVTSYAGGGLDTAFGSSFVTEAVPEPAGPALAATAIAAVLARSSAPPPIALTERPPTPTQASPTRRGQVPQLSGRTTRATSTPSLSAISVGQSLTRNERPSRRPGPSSTWMCRTEGCAPAPPRSSAPPPDSIRTSPCRSRAAPPRSSRRSRHAWGRGSGRT